MRHPEPASAPTPNGLGLPYWVLGLMAVLVLGALALIIVVPTVLTVVTAPTLHVPATPPTPATQPSAALQCGSPGAPACVVIVWETMVHPDDLLPNDDLALYRGLIPFVPTVTNFLASADARPSEIVPVWRAAPPNASVVCAQDTYGAPDVWYTAGAWPLLSVNPLSGNFIVVDAPGLWATGGTSGLRFSRYRADPAAFDNTTELGDLNATSALGYVSATMELSWERVLETRMARHLVLFVVATAPDFFGGQRFALMAMEATWWRRMDERIPLRWTVPRAIWRGTTRTHLLLLHNADSPSYVDYFAILGEREAEEGVVRVDIIFSIDGGHGWSGRSLVARIADWPDAPTRMPTAHLARTVAGDTLWLEQANGTLAAYTRARTAKTWARAGARDIFEAAPGPTRIIARDSNGTWVGTIRATAFDTYYQDPALGVAVAAGIVVTPVVYGRMLRPGALGGARSVVDEFVASPTRGDMYVLQGAALGMHSIEVSAATCRADDLVPGCITGATYPGCTPNAHTIPGGCLRVSAPFDVAVVRRVRDEGATIYAALLVDPDTTRATVAYAVATSRAGVVAVAYEQVLESSADGLFVALKVAYFVPDNGVAAGLVRVGDHTIEARYDARQQAWSEGGYGAGDALGLHARPGTAGFTLVYSEVVAAADAADAYAVLTEASEDPPHKACDEAAGERARTRVVHLDIVPRF